MSVYRPITGQKVPPTYTETKNFVSTKFQKGKEVLPRELNEWQDIKDMSTKGLFSDILGNLFIGDAFAVKQAAITANDFSIASGTLYTRFGPILAENKLYSEVSTNTWMKVVQEPDQFIEDFTYGDLTEGQRALTTPTAGNRIDLVVLVITKREIDATYDTDIKNAVLGHETAVREKLFYTVRVLPNFNMNNIATFESLFSYYNDEYCIRIPIAQITRLQNNDNILDSQIIDLRHIVLSNNIYDTLKNYIDIDIQGANKGFNADKVDGKDVNDLRDASPDVLWTSAKILEAINAYAKGISPQPGIIGRYNPAIDAEVQTPTAVWEDGYGSRFISTATITTTILGRPTSFTANELYEYKDIGGGVFEYVSQNSQTGWLLEDKNLLQNIIKSVDGTWFSFGGVSNHNSLSGVMFAKLNSGVDDIIGFDTEDPKHVTSEYMDTIELRLTSAASGISTNETNLNNHTALDVTAVQAVHGILQGSGNGFDADKLDGADLTTEMVTTLDTVVPTQKAIKDYLNTSYLALVGGTMSGNLSIPKLGIGQAAGTEALEVTGNIKTSLAIKTPKTTYSSSVIYNKEDTGTSIIDVQLDGDGSSNYRFRIGGGYITTAEKGLIVVNNNSIANAQHLLTSSNATSYVNAYGGYFAIGKSTADEKLDVAGNIKLDNELISNDEQLLIKTNGTAGTLKAVNVFSDNFGTTQTSQFAIMNTYGETVNQAQHSFKDSSQGSYVCRRGGNFGVGDTSPSEKLSVAGNIKASGGYICGGSDLLINTTSNGTANQIIRLFKAQTTTGLHQFLIYDNDGVHPQHYFPSSSINSYLCGYGGNLGVGGTTTPTEKLHVFGNIKATTIFANASIKANADDPDLYTQLDGASIYLHRTAGSSYINTTAIGRDLIFRVSKVSTTDTYPLILKGTTGYVGILNTNPTEALDVNGNIKASGSIQAGSITAPIYVGSTSTNQDFFLTFVDSSSSGVRSLYTDINIAYNPSTNTLGVRGSITGYYTNGSATLTATPVAGVSTSAVRDERYFPIGSIVSFVTSQTFQRNATVPVCLRTDSIVNYTVSGESYAGSSLYGKWVHRGGGLAQKVSNTL